MTTQIQEYSKTEAALSFLREQYGDASYDVATPDGMESAKTARKEVRGYRTGLEAMRKQIKAPALAQCNLIDSEAKRITTELRKIETPIDDQIKAHEAEIERKRQEKIAAEAKRVENIQARIKSIRDVVQSVTYMGNPTSKAVQIKINDIESIEIEGFEEFSDVAASTKAEELAKLLQIHAAAVHREEEDARLALEREELAAQRAEQSEHEAEQRKRNKEAKDEIEVAAKKLADDQAVFEKQQNEAAEEDRKAKEAKQAEIDSAHKAKADADALAKRSKYPGDSAIIYALADFFDISDEVAASWFAQIRKAA